MLAKSHIIIKEHQVSLYQFDRSKMGDYNPAPPDTENPDSVCLKYLQTI